MILPHVSERGYPVTWETVTAIISVITVGIAVGRIIYGLSQTLTRLNCAVENLNTTISAFVSDNESEHEELYGGIEELRESISDIKAELTLRETEKN